MSTNEEEVFVTQHCGKNFKMLKVKSAKLEN